MELNFGKLTLYIELKKLGVHVVKAEYAGSGDCGDITEVIFSGEGEEILNLDNPRIESQVEDLFWDLLPQGFEINEGGSGKITWNLQNDFVPSEAQKEEAKKLALKQGLISKDALETDTGKEFVCAVSLALSEEDAFDMYDVTNSLVDSDLLNKEIIVRSDSSNEAERYFFHSSLDYNGGDYVVNASFYSHELDIYTDGPSDCSLLEDLFYSLLNEASSGFDSGEVTFTISPVESSESPALLVEVVVNCRVEHQEESYRSESYQSFFSR
jgi:hypothetical protein